MSAADADELVGTARRCVTRTMPATSSRSRHGVLSRSATGAVHGRDGHARCPIVLRIGYPCLESGVRPGADPPTEMNGRGKSSSRDPPIKRRSRQRRDPDDVPETVKRRYDVTPEETLIGNRDICTHRLTVGGDTPCALRRAWLRRRNFDETVRRKTNDACRGILRLQARFIVLRWRTIARSRAIHSRTSDRRQPMQRPRNFSFLGNLPNRLRPTIIQHGRRVNLATSCALSSSCTGGYRSLTHFEIDTGLLRAIGLELGAEAVALFITGGILGWGNCGSQESSPTVG